MYINKIRKIHRYLGLFLGVQFLFWTVGGLYFSWTDIRKIKGFHLLIKPLPIALDHDYSSLNAAFNVFRQTFPSARVTDVAIVAVRDACYYRCIFENDTQVKACLIHTKTNQLRAEITEEEAIWVASQRLSKAAQVVAVQKLNSEKDDIAYRGRPFPAYAIKYDYPLNTTAYVAAQYASVEALRSNEWKFYDILWMLHIMDYGERKDFNNTLLRIFSALGVATTLSGFALYIVTNKHYRRWKKKHKANETKTH